MAMMMQYQDSKSLESPSIQDINNELITDDEDFIMTNVSTKVYERSRIKALADERENVQKKTFTKWINSQIDHVGYNIKDLYMDLRDGKLLLKLLEILSNDVVPKATRGRMRIHCLENVDKCLGFLYDQKVHLENVGAHDIVDGNPRLTLGLVWTMILRFQVQDITIDEMDEVEAADFIQQESTNKLASAAPLVSTTQKRRLSLGVGHSPKDALLLWCQIKTAGYPGVNIRNFSSSWRTGLGFCALIHKHRPDLLEYSNCLRSNNATNLQNAFDVAEQQLGLAPLLDVEDVDVNQPEERSIITYVASYYHYFNSTRHTSVLNKRLHKLLNQAIDNENMQKLYRDLLTKLLEWIQMKIVGLNERQFSNSMSGLQDQLMQFNKYRREEKPPKYQEKSDIEVLLFTIKSQLMSTRQIIVVMTSESSGDELNLNRINSAWDGDLNSAEHNRETALHDELRRQEKLAVLAARFMKRAKLRSSWINVNLELLAHQTLGHDYPTIRAALTKHEAFETDIYAYECNIKALEKLAEQLEQEVYEDVLTVLHEKNEIVESWQKLLSIVNERREQLDNMTQLYSMLNELDEVLGVIEELRHHRINESDYGNHVLEVEELLRRHELLESDIRWLDQRLERVVAEVNRYLRYSEKDFQNNSRNNALLVEKKRHVLASYDELLQLAEKRKDGLEHSLQVRQYLVEIQTEEQWMKEILEVLRNSDLGNDMAAVDRTMKKHKLLELEIEGRRIELEKKLMEGKDLSELSEIGSEKIAEKNEAVLELWEVLVENTENRKVRLVGEMEFLQLVYECDEMCVWMEEFGRFFDSDLSGLGGGGWKKNENGGRVERTIRRNQENMGLVEQKRGQIEELHSQAGQLLGILEDEARRGDVARAIDRVDSMYTTLLKKAQMLQEKLLDQLSMQRLLNDADSVRSWISEKEKFLVNFIPSEDIEELEILKLRFESFENELTKRAEQVYHVNTLSENLSHSNSSMVQVVVDNQDDLNEAWNKMADVVDEKRDELLSKYHFHKFCVECEQTVEWIAEKIRVLRSLETREIDSEDNLETVLNIQRRVDHLERDMCAIEAKMDYLDGQGELLIRSGLGGGVKMVEDKLDEVHDKWRELQEGVKQVMSQLEEQGGAHRLILELEDMRGWIEAQSDFMANRDAPETADAAERMVLEYNMACSEIENKEEVVKGLLESGMEYLSRDDVTGIEANQLGQRLDMLKKSWNTLKELTGEKKPFLDAYIKSLMFFEAAKELDKIMNQHENFLNKDLHSSNLIGLHEAVTEQEEFYIRIERDHEVLQQVLDQGSNLIVEGHFQSDKIKSKCKALEDRWNKNLEMAKQRKNEVKDTLKLQELLQDIEDLEDSLLDKNNALSQINMYSASKSKTALYAQCKSIQGELEAQKSKVDEINRRGAELMKEMPQLENEVKPSLDNLACSWNEVNKLLQDRLDHLSKEDKEQMFEDSAKSMLDFLANLESQMITDDGDVAGPHRTGVRAVDARKKELAKHDEELLNKKKLLDSLDTEDLKRNNPEKAVAIEEMQQQVQMSLNNLEPCLANKKATMDQVQAAEEALDELEEENDWLSGKMEQLANKMHVFKGEDMCRVTVQVCHNSERWFRGFKKELENRRDSDRMKSLYQKTERMIEDEHVKGGLLEKELLELRGRWEEAGKNMDEYEKLVMEQKKLHEYLMDVSEACSWISEKELVLTCIKLDKKDENMIGRCVRTLGIIEEEIVEYYKSMEELRRRCNELCVQIPGVKDQLCGVQEDAERNYAALRSLVMEKKEEQRLFMDLCKVYELYEDLEAWIAARTIVARRDNVGRDLDECDAFRSQFGIFAEETNRVGARKLAEVESYLDLIIQSNSEGAHAASMWKDRIGEAWADLLELVDTRIQLLKAAWNRHKWLRDSSLLLETIEEKQAHLEHLNKLGNDPKSVLMLDRKLRVFETELVRLDKEVTVTCDSLDPLLPLYSEDQKDELLDQRERVLEAFRKLRLVLEERKVSNVDLADFHKLMAMLRELELWIETVQKQMDLPGPQNKPRDVSAVELLLSIHRSLKSEMDSKEENFSICLNLGRTLLRSKHSQSQLIREKCKQISDKREKLCTKWYSVLDQLSLMVEVYQWARDAAVAESWLLSQENQLDNANTIIASNPDNLEETVAMLQRLVLLQKSTKNQEEKFEQLKRLTTLEIRAQHLSPRHTSRQLQSPTKTASSSSTQPTLVRSGSMDSNLDVSCASRTAVPVQQTAPTRPLPSGSARLDLHTSATPPRPSPSSSRTTSNKQPPSPLTQSRPAPSNKAATLQPTSSTKAGMSASTERLSNLATNLAGVPQSRGVLPSEIKMKGALYRKHQWNSRGQKASNRSWKSLYVEILNCRLYFFKDERHYRERPGQFFHHEMPLPLSDVVAAPAADYVKRPCVFRVRFRAAGTEYLFQAGSIIEMTRWVEAINAASSTTGGSSSTLPAALSASQHTLTTSRDAPPRRSESVQQNLQNSGGGLKRFFSSLRLKK